jgi:hypothetical protein
MVSLEGEEFHQFRVDELFLSTEGHFGEHADFGQLFETKKTCRDFRISATCFKFMSLVGTWFCNVFEICDLGDRSRTGSNGILKMEGFAGGDLLGEVSVRPVSKWAVEGAAAGDVREIWVEPSGVNPAEVEILEDLVLAAVLQVVDEG